jgi:Flp pilus assembly protein TadD
MNTKNQSHQALKTEDIKTFQLAQSFFNKSDFKSSESLLRNLLSQYDTHADICHFHGLALYQLKFHEEAISQIKKAIQLDPNNFLYPSNFCEILRLQGRLEEAISYGEAAVQLAPESDQALCNLGIAYFDLKNYSDAEKRQKQAIEINPNNTSALNNLGSIM